MTVLACFFFFHKKTNIFTFSGLRSGLLLCYCLKTKTSVCHQISAPFLPYAMRTFALMQQNQALHPKHSHWKHLSFGTFPRNCVFHSRYADVFNSNGEAYENAWDLPPAAETVVAVPQAVEEGAGMFVQVCCVTWIVNYSCRMFCKVNYQ